MSRILKVKDGKINFTCLMDECKHCCCKQFSGITDTLSNVDGRAFEEIVLTPEDYNNLYKAGRSDLIVEGYSERMNKKYYKMDLEADGTCKALKNGRCTVHKYKPTLCKAYPFYFDMFSGLCAIECEGFSDENWSDLSDYQASFEESKKMYNFWIDFYSTE